jgi:ATP-dependent Clp protease adaptor protein ClpS
MADQEFDLLEKTRTKAGKKVKRPSLYRVILLNDDYTTMDFVVYILRRVFNKPEPEATRIMLHVHRRGEGIAGEYTRDIAETKIDTVHRLARENSFPLRCRMEKA